MKDLGKTNLPKSLERSMAFFSNSLLKIANNLALHCLNKKVRLAYKSRKDLTETERRETESHKLFHRCPKTSFSLATRSVSYCNNRVCEGFLKAVNPFSKSC